MNRFKLVTARIALMFRRTTVPAALVVVLCALLQGAAKEPRSGPRVGTAPAPFHPVNVTGPWEGKKVCLVEAYGSNPVALVFARDLTEPLSALLKTIDAATTKQNRLRSFAVYLTDDDKAEATLKNLAKANALKQCVLCIDNPAGPRGYQLAPEAEVTVVLYARHKVEATFAFRKGELKGEASGRIMTRVRQMLPQPMN